MKDYTKEEKIKIDKELSNLKKSADEKTPSFKDIINYFNGVEKVFSYYDNKVHNIKQPLNAFKINRNWYLETKEGGDVMVFSFFKQKYAIKN